MKGNNILGIEGRFISNCPRIQALSCSTIAQIVGTSKLRGPACSRIVLTSELSATATSFRVIIFWDSISFFGEGCVDSHAHKRKCVLYCGSNRLIKFISLACFKFIRLCELWKTLIEQILVGNCPNCLPFGSSTTGASI